MLCRVIDKEIFHQGWAFYFGITLHCCLPYRWHRTKFWISLWQRFDSFNNFLMAFPVPVNQITESAEEEFSIVWKLDMELDNSAYSRSCILWLHGLNESHQWQLYVTVNLFWYFVSHCNVQGIWQGVGKNFKLCGIWGTNCAVKNVNCAGLYNVVTSKIGSCWTIREWQLCLDQW